MIGIVAVSHSARLGEAALELALQMVQGGGVRVRVAAGAGADADGAPVLGTDAVAVAAEIDDLASDCDGVLVLMDLGSAVLSAELALELRSSDVPVRLTPAPFVEGLLAAVVSAASGGSLDLVAGEASAALGAKTGQLGGPEADSTPEEVAATGLAPEADSDAVTRVVVVRNPLGIHARPAALIAEASAGADVRLRRLPDGPDASAASLTRVLILGAAQGDEIELSASGADSEAVLARVAALFDDGFGEGTGIATAAPRAAGPNSREHASWATDPTPGVPVTLVRAGTVLRGRGVSGGRVAAPAVLLGPPVDEPDPGVVIPASDREREVSAIEGASVAVADQLRSRTARATGEARAILDASRLLASDPELVGEASVLVRTKGRSAARAVWETAVAHEAGLTALGGRMAERAADIRDVRDRLVAEILEIDVPGVPDRDEAFALVAIDLAPADAAALAGGNCVALVTEKGGPTSHTAIIARSLGIPAVVGVAGSTRIVSDVTVLVDGDRGTVEIDPDEATVAAAEAAAVAVPFSGEAVLADGRRISLLANIGGAADADAAVSAGAEGVGLFRTEFCFLDRVDAPSIDEQVAAYRGVLAAFHGRRVVVRTLDAGSDKPLPFANADTEENPALGIRGLRIAHRSPALLDDQLRALALAAEAESAVVEVMAPMVATVDEARAFAESARSAGLMTVGVMIETPSAALLASEMLEVVDFVSIGTNDLAQYTLAADRLLAELGELNDPWQPAVLRLIGAVGDAGRRWDLPVGVCGEAAADPALAPVLVGLGVTSLSMTPRALGRVAAALAAVTEAQCEAAAEAVLRAATVADTRAVAIAALAAGTADGPIV
ncbi:phosphoenolpyruvate--protein phosphotransferase [Microbacterium foliorum]|uniref:Phosphocarrier protein HPr n=1 Tax=Microbacterium foliorum TaxID=104336 RepID=A0A0F0L1P2_9MICO|nr:phosphoenolpyruvate--protein phosphotransferase [Microbacterium foliorum]AXL11560.1 phosphoenolpyruvate--protein phosphotransferase [Microbacterium foliorum]KJL27048.1 Phosphoenolpyruvate-protein phosphotransferase [Microbacterium foliorum]